MKKQIKVIVRNRIYIDDLKGSLENAIDIFSNYKKYIPEEFRNNTKVDIVDFHGNSKDAYFEVVYLRPETDEEEKLRLEEEKNIEERKRQEDLKLLERLKREYER